MKHTQMILALLGVASMFASTALAHFPWLVQTEDGKAALYFGESLADRTYKLPSSIAKAEVLFVSHEGKTNKLKLQSVDSDAFVGLVSEKSVSNYGIVASQVTFGVYHGSRLEYYAMHRTGKLPSSRELGSYQAHNLALSAEAVDSSDGVDVYVTWHGKPLVGADVKLFCSEGHEEGSATTDEMGKVSFTDSQVEEGLNGIMVGHTAKDQSGELDQQPYNAELHYLTLTFTDPQDFEKMPHSEADSSKQSTPGVDFADLPLAVTSFGAVRLGDSIYVYGGHTGDAHEYSTDTQSNQLLKLDLQSPTKAWVKVAEDQRLQGLALVAHGTRLISIGGFSAANAPGEEHDLHSQTSVRSFDISTQTWTDLPPLPDGRSSHDAAVIDDVVYVVGGWCLNGDDETRWHHSALSLNLSKPNAEWEELTPPPFARRALATVAHSGKLYVIGGMNERGGPTREIAVYDPSQNTWSTGPELVGEGGMEGFGVAAWSIDGRLITTTYSGQIQELSDDGSQWNVVGKTQDARFFHRLLPIGDRQLLSVGGANMEQHAKFLDPEVVEIPLAKTELR